MPMVEKALGLNNRKDLFEKLWEDHGFKGIKKQSERDRITPTINEMFEKPENREEKFFQKRLEKKLEKANDVETKDTIDRTVMEDSIPLVFDPEILQILKGEAPILDRIPQEGYDGYTIVSNRIDEFGDPMGFISESDSIDLSSRSGGAHTMGKVSQDMKIYADVEEIADFSQRAGEHYMNIRDTAIGAAMARHANLKAQTILYGDPSEGLTDGSPGDSNAYPGLKSKFTTTDKSGVDITGDQALLQDIKSEIKGLLQSGKNVLKSDIEVWTSHDVFDHLENEMGTKVRFQPGDDRFDFGYEQIYIKGIPVIADHNIDEHTYDDGELTYNPGDPGDVFIVNKRSARFRNLAPLSTLPLARVGLSDRAAIYEYGALVERSNGQWGKHLSAYSV